MNWCRVNFESFFVTTVVVLLTMMKTWTAFQNRHRFFVTKVQRHRDFVHLLTFPAQEHNIKKTKKPPICSAIIDAVANGRSRSYYTKGAAPAAQMNML